MAMVDEDSAAYRQVMAALRQPKSTAEEKAGRTEALQRATRQATETPLDTLRACQQALRGAVVVAANASRAAVADLLVGIELLSAAARSAGVNVDANLGSLKDQAFVARAQEERRELEQESLADAARARALL
jgi:formiminotetrahydrofolate cyclodeaminase